MLDYTIIQKGEGNKLPRCSAVLIIINQVPIGLLKIGNWNAMHLGKNLPV